MARRARTELLPLSFVSLKSLRPSRIFSGGASESFIGIGEIGSSDHAKNEMANKQNMNDVIFISTFVLPAHFSVGLKQPFIQDILMVLCFSLRLDSS